MNNAMGPIFNGKKLLKSEVCESPKQCTEPTDSTISDQCVDVQSAHVHGTHW